MCVLYGSQKNVAFIFKHGINRLVFVTERECVYCAVRTESLNINQVNFSLEMVKHSARHACTNRGDESPCKFYVIHTVHFSII